MGRADKARAAMYAMAALLAIAGLILLGAGLPRGNPAFHAAALGVVALLAGGGIGAAAYLTHKEDQE
jgi:hypothetical protein